jgi:hypothetical protein
MLKVMPRTLAGLCLILLSLLASGCALSRADQLARQSDRVESKLVRERDRVAGLNTPDAATRLGYLTNLRTELTFADTARKLAPRLLQDPAQVDAAYDVLEEVYSTIDWNIPLSPTDASRRAMPNLFGAGGLDFSKLAPAAK